MQQAKNGSVMPLITYCENISKSLQLEAGPTPRVPFFPWCTCGGSDAEAPMWGVVSLLRKSPIKVSGSFMDPDVCVCVWEGTRNREY